MRDHQAVARSARFADHPVLSDRDADFASIALRIPQAYRHDAFAIAHAYDSPDGYATAVADPDPIAHAHPNADAHTAARAVRRLPRHHLELRATWP
jgi:hypothetical protein